MLTIEGVVPFLLERELLEERLIVDGDVLVTHVPRRNHNFRVATERGAGCFLKQGVGPDKVDAVAHEARVYRWLESHPAFGALEPFLPACRSFDAQESTLVLALVEQSQTLDEYHQKNGRLPRALGGALGDALGTLHRLTRPATTAQRPEGQSPGSATRFLHFHRPGLETFIGSSWGMLEVIRAVQQSTELCRLLDQLAGDWRDDALIHGDLRWDNCHVAEPASDGRRMQIKFVDWETGGFGDPCWDVGTVFSQCLVFWLLSTPLTRDTPPEEFAALARFPLRKMQPALRSFWRSYARVLGLAAVARVLCLEWAFTVC